MFWLRLISNVELWRRVLQCVRKVAVYLDLWEAAKSAVYRDRPRTLNELKTASIAFIRNISQAHLQKVFANKIKQVQACIDARGHHFQHRL
jgi:uncharacterized protein involved in propanediol utilization